MSGKNRLGNYESLKSLSVAPGAVFSGPWEQIDHEKFVIIAGVSDDRVLVCTVLINSRINPFIMRRQQMLDCQVYVKSVDYEFLSHDSFVNCAQPVIGQSSHFLGEEFKYRGMLTALDLQQVRESVVKSGLLTEDEIKHFFNE